MEKNIFRSVSKRENILLNGIYTLFFAIASYPKLMLEVFIRRDMGRRYFTVASAATVVIILFFLPMGIHELQEFYSRRLSLNYGYYGQYESFDETSFWGKFATWYIFILLFVWFSRKRRKESFPHSNVYDFNYFSLSTGTSLPFFYNLPFLKNKPSGYAVEVFIEPAFFFIIGLLLKLMNQPIGSILILCSICYGLSYAAAYKQQDDAIQDKIDDIILAEEFENSFVYGYEQKTTRGVRWGQRPSDEELRRKMASRMYRKNDTVDAEFTVL